MQGSGGEGRDIRDGVLDEGLGGPFAHTLGALLHAVEHLRLLVAHPEGQGTEEDVALRQGIERIHDLAVEQLKVRGGAHVHAGRPADETVEAVGRKFVEAALLAAILLDALHDLIALFPEAVHVHDLLGRVLEIAVDDHDAVALRLLKTCEHSGLLAEVAAEMDADDVGIGGAGTQDLAPGAVAGAVVHKQELVVDAGSAQDFAEAFCRDGDHFFFVIRGENNREHGDRSLL